MTDVLLDNMKDIKDNEIGGGIEIEGQSKIGWPDMFVIICYFLFVLFIGLWSSRRASQTSVSGYFLAARSMHWIPVGASLFASNIGSGHFIGLAGSGAAAGIGVAGFEQSAIYILMLLGWLFVPVYMSSGIYTMPEYLKERFGGQRIRVYLSFLALMLYIFTKISADLYAGALFMQMALNKNSDEWLYLSILILLIIAAVFTITGGLTAVIWTDFVQTILMIVGAFILMVISIYEVDGFSNLVRKYPFATAKIRAVDSNNELCGGTRKDYMNLLKSIHPGESDLPWTGMVFGLTINSIWYWCTDQVIVQRTLSSKNMTHAKGGCILAAYLKFLPLWLLVIPGMAARILFPDRVACADPVECERICNNPGGCSNIAYVELVLNLLPTGMRGLMLAVMMAALMSSLTSIFNSATTIFTIDVWTRFRKQPSDFELLIVARLFVIVLVVISVIWIPVVRESGSSQLFDYIQSISSFLAPPICAVYLLAIFWSRTTEQGAFYGLMVGLAVGLLRFIVQFSFQSTSCGSGISIARPYFVEMFVDKIHYLHFSCILFIITNFVVISVSLITPPIPQDCIHRLTFWSRHSTAVRKSIDNDDNTKPHNYDKSTHQNDDSSRENRTEMVIVQPRTDVPPWKQKLANICGMSEMISEKSCEEEIGPSLSEEDKATAAATFLTEEPFWKKFVDVNAIIVLSLTTFVWGFFA